MVYLKEGRKITNKECRKLCEVKNDKQQMIQKNLKIKRFVREFFLLNI